MKKNIISRMYVLFILIVACHKESRTEQLEAKFDEVYAKTRFSCDNIKDSLFFKCRFEKDTFCISHNADNYESYCGLAICARTTSNTLNLADTNVLCGKFLEISFVNNSALFKPEIELLSAVDDAKLTFYEQCEKRLKVGKYPIRSNAMSEKEGYMVQIVIKYEVIDTLGVGRTVSFFDLRSSYGSQPENAYLQIDDVIKKEDRRYYYYTVKGRFNARMYKQLNSFIASEYMGEIKDASFVNKLVVPK